MILVTLGTQDKPFARLIKAVETQIDRGKIKEKVIVQAGSTKYKPKEKNKEQIEIISFLTEKEFNSLFEKADLIITHAGVGTIIKGLQNNKKMIVAPRLEKYGEHVNDHQMQILENFSKEGYIVPLTDFEKLDEAIVKVEKFVPKKYKTHNEKFVKSIKEEIVQLLNS